jgi:hypothetical protein
LRSLFCDLDLWSLKLVLFELWVLLCNSFASSFVPIMLCDLSCLWTISLLCCYYVFSNMLILCLTLNLWEVLFSLTLIFVSLVCRFFDFDLETFWALHYFDLWRELFSVWACRSLSDGNSLSPRNIHEYLHKTVSNKVSGTYRFGIRDRQKHSVKTPSNPYQGRSHFGYSRESLRDLLSRSTNGWVVGDHSTTVDHLET